MRPHPIMPSAIVRILRIACVVALLALLHCTVPHASAQRQQPVVRTDPQISVRAYSSQSRNYIGSVIPFTIEVQGVTSVDPIELRDLIDGLRIEYQGSSQGSSSSIQIINGRRTEFRSVSTNLQYAIVPLRAGRYTIPAIELEINGETRRTNAVTIEAIGSQTRNDVRATLEVDHATAFVSQPITASLHIDAIPELLSVPMILAPETVAGTRVFALPESKSSADPTTSPALRAMEHPVRITINGINQQATTRMFGQTAHLMRSQIELMEQPAMRWTLRVVIVPTTGGTLTIDPMTVRIEVSRGPRTRVAPMPEVVVLETKPLQITVNPLPPDPSPIPNTPWDRSFGLPIVGRFDIESRATPSTVNVGDPIELGITITGWEPLERIGRLDLGDIDGFDPAFRIPTNSIAPSRDDLALRFTAQIRAATEQSDQIPGIAFRAFDPVDRVWRTVRSEPVPLEIRATRVVRAGDVTTQAPGAGGTTLQATSAGNVLGPIDVSPAILEYKAFTLASVLRSPAIVAALAVPPIACLSAACAVALLRRSQSRNRTPSSSTAARHAHARLDAVDPNMPPQQLADAVSAAMRDFTTDRGFAEHAAPPAIKQVLDACDAIRFGGDAQSATHLVDRAKAAIHESRKP